MAGRPRQPARVRGGLRRVARRPPHAGGARRRAVAGRGARGGRRPRHPLRRRRARWLLHHRRRRRRAHRPTQGLPGQRHPVGELTRRRRPPPTVGAHRRPGRRRTSRALVGHAGTGAGRAPHRVRVPARGARAGGAALARTGDRRRRRSRARRAGRRRAHAGAPGFGAGDRAPRAWGPSSHPCWPIARSSTVGLRPTCASTSPVSCRSRIPTRSAASSTGGSTPHADHREDDHQDHAGADREVSRVRPRVVVRHGGGGRCVRAGRAGRAR